MCVGAYWRAAGGCIINLVGTILNICAPEMDFVGICVKLVFNDDGGKLGDYPPLFEHSALMKKEDLAEIHHF